MNTINLNWKGVFGDIDLVAKIRDNKVLGKRLFLFHKDKSGTLHGMGYYSLKDDKFHKLTD